MDAVDVSEHYEVTAAEETPSLLSIIIDTNPRAWAALDDRLPLSKAVANILVFVNAHLAFSNANQGLLTYLMFGLIADTEARQFLIAPTHDTIDFRAACFCHGSVVDTGFVCSICLSIFCEIPQNAECLTCGTQLALGKYGSKPAVVARRKKKRVKRVTNGGSGRDETASATGTPRP
ncbi:hypothetical protein E4U42_000935 [Claviceps africana]|uniref:General transcription and DNA repair factor IIH subunit TFB4 n=1 Tax=Claviceps africana TaxID=83212 RepID=A0A8K0J9J8_9HYPO|nr:hypothetical protein E4U42_000935 [Claviceps africana]